MASARTADIEHVGGLLRLPASARSPRGSWRKERLVPYLPRVGKTLPCAGSWARVRQMSMSARSYHLRTCDPDRAGYQQFPAKHEDTPCRARPRVVLADPRSAAAVASDG